MIVKGNSGTFKQAPEGDHKAVCVDLVDLGMVETKHGIKHQIRLVWEIEAKMENGKRFTYGNRYAPTIHLKSTLGKLLKSWRGRAFTAEELDGFDLEKLVGAPCELRLEHVEADGKVWCNLDKIKPDKSGSPLTPSGEYVRVKNRPKQDITESSDAPF